MIIVLDTNIYVSAAIEGEISEEIIKLAAKTHIIKLVTSEEILQELREKLLSKFNQPEDIVDIFINRIRKITEIVEAEEKVNIITRDSDDNKILECALAGNADLIITADQDLIKLKSFKGIGIIHPKTFSWTFPEYFKKIK